jgi:hypothetical protein
MTDPNYTALLLVVDRSGSMNQIKSDMESGLNALLTEQRALPGLLTVDLFTFDTEIKHVWKLANSPDLNVQIHPRGSTALLDAIGIAVTEFGRTLAELPEHARPSTVQVVVVTDGLENASVEYNLVQVREMLRLQQETYGWDFVFLGANQDAVLTGTSLGFDAGSSMTFAAGAAGVDATTKGMGRYMSDVRMKQKKAFLAEERRAALQRDAERNGTDPASDGPAANAS